MGDEYCYTKEEMDHLRWIHAHPRPDIDLLGPCPEWCKGRPHDVRGDVASEQDHTSEVMIPLMVEVGVPTTPREATQQPLDAGRGDRMDSVRGQLRPPRDLRPDLHRRRRCPDQIRTLADNLIPQAARLREFADLLESLRVEDMPD